MVPPVHPPHEGLNGSSHERSNANASARALEQHTLGQPQAQIDLAESQAVSNLIQALGATPNAVVQIGSVLLVKVRDTTVVRNLTQLELAHWERNPGLFRNPEKALQELQQAYREGNIVLGSSEDELGQDTRA